MTPGELLQALIAKRGIPSPNALADQLELESGGAVSAGSLQSAMSRLQSGKTPRPATLQPIARFFGLDASVFQTPEAATACAERMGLLRDEADAPAFAGYPKNQKGRIPVVGTAKMGDDGFYEEFSSIPGAGDGFVEHYSDDKMAYCLRMKGMSMFPAIRDGWYVIVEPSGTPSEGEYVLIKKINGVRMVKEFLFRRQGSIEVMSVNGGDRLTIEMQEIHELLPICAVIPPSKWRPA